MKRLKYAAGLMAASISLVVGMGMSGWAQVSVKVIGPDNTAIDVTGRNAARGDEALILYDKAFGPSTRTNAYGVEVIAVPTVPPSTDDNKTYRVQTVTSVWDCMKPENAGTSNGLPCGNAAIPENGVVLSSTGSKRDWLKTLKAGDVITLQESWFQQKQSPISVINPTPLTNPMGSGFPGYRASNQLVIYDAQYGRPNTGTNEFGFEVTVKNGIVVEQEGSDSAIPPDGYVISGHGKARSWLIANAPLGAKMNIAPDGQTLTSIVDFDTYLYQFDQRWAQSPCADKVWTSKPSADKVCDTVRNQRSEALRLVEARKSGAALTLMQQALEDMNRSIWKSYQLFPADTLRGAWHRPVEKTSQAVGQTLDRLKAAGLNAVFLETYFHGYTIFPSQTYQAYGLPAQNPKFAGADLLALWVQEAHKRNMKVHIWFQTFYGGTKAYLSPGPIVAKYPKWANVQYSALVSVKQEPAALPPVTMKNGMMGNSVNGSSTAVSLPLPELKKSPDQPVPSTLEQGAYFLDPANPEVQTFLLKLIDEIVSRYDIDGFQLDYIRYPASFPADRFSYRKTTWGYTDLARQDFKNQFGIDPVDIDPKNPEFNVLWAAWNQYKVSQVNNFVKQAAQTIRQKNPAIKISAAVFPEADSALAVKHQDWRLWASQGWVDFYAPMTLTSAIKVVERDTRNMVSVTHGKVPVYSGLFGPFNDNSAEHVLSQIDSAKQAGASGYVLFDTAHLTARMLEALKVAQTPPVVEPVEPAVKPQPAETPTAKPKKRHWWSWRK